MVHRFTCGKGYPHPIWIYVVRGGVWHGVILGGKGNMRFHDAIIVHNDSKEKDELVYGCDNVVAKRTFDNPQVD